LASGGALGWAQHAFGSFFAKNWMAGQPISFCLQNLHETDLRTKPVSGKAMAAKAKMKVSLTQEKLRAKFSPPIKRGTIETRKSGTRLIQDIFFSLKRSGEPFLNNKEHIFPFPKAHSFPK
jgi:hypothetical protein